MARRFLTLTAAAAFVFATSAPAWAVPNPNVPGGVFKGTSSGTAIDVSIGKRASVRVSHTVNSILASMLDGANFQGTSLWIELTSGKIYQETGTFITGNNMFDQPLSAEPSATMHDDTFIHSGDTGFGDGLANGGKASQLYPGGIVTTGFAQAADSAGTQKLNLSGIDTTPNNSGILLNIGQVTLSNQAQGFWELGLISATSDLQVGQGIIMNGMLLLPTGVVIPLPAAAWMGLSLLGGIGSLRLIRRKK